MGRSINLNLLATICARAGSKGVPGKNIRPLLGKPLIAHTIEQAKAVGVFKNIVVSTDSAEIADVAKKFGAEAPFLRPPEFATDKAPKWPALRHALRECEKIYQTQYDLIVDLDPTSPLRAVEDIQNCINLLIEKNASNVITATPARRSPYFNLIEIFPDGQVGLAKAKTPPITCRQDAPQCYDMNASIYVWRREALLNSETVFLPKTALYVMPEERSIDIDSPLDFEFVEFLAGKREKLL